MNSPARQKNLLQRRLWSFLSLWALLALAMPQMMWACSMTGKVASTPALACPCAAQTQTTAGDSSAQTVHHCCDRVPLPTSDTAGQDEKGALSQTRAAHFSFQTWQAASTLRCAAAFELCAPLTQKAVFPSTTSPPLISQHTRSHLRGRAPPF